MKSYWVASGANEMLLKILKNFIKDIPDIDGCMTDSDVIFCVKMIFCYLCSNCFANS